MNNDYEEENDKILKAIRSLRKDNPLRLQAEMVLADPSVAIEDLEPILNAFRFVSFRKRKDHIAAAWLIANANWSDSKRLILSRKLTVLMQEAMSLSKSGGIARQSNYIMLLAEPALIYWLGHNGGHTHSHRLLWGAVMLVAIVTPSDRYSKVNQSRKLLQTLGELGDPRCLGTIATAIKYNVVRDSAGSALSKVVANIKPDHYGILPGDTVPALCQAIAKADVQSTLVILTALTYIGDGRAIKTVERLALNPPSREIGIAASQLLPILRQRVIENNAPIQLLRAGTRPHNEEHHLLRAASGANTDDPDILLRATGVESD